MEMCYEPIDVSIINNGFVDVDYQLRYFKYLDVDLVYIIFRFLLHSNTISPSCSYSYCIYFRHRSLPVLFSAYIGPYWCKTCAHS